ncbi:hypothetical protein SASPL_125998 [Salvia splendens]|uniref:CYTH domain-containing protein n=1 Tax=Salvia splendens TaxID=180675 RepID=A0A8X8XIM7_SALSN|nr:hypothetical protein SASPL_125998 [Salvia splendens]
MEIEVKLRLPSSAVLSAYHRRTHLQENLFFDGPNAELASSFAALRIRFYDLDSRCVLSLKSKPQISGGISRIEGQEEPLDPTVGRHCAADPSRLLLIEPSDIIRRVREELEVDETLYSFGTCYEVECESSDPDEAKILIEGLLQSNGIEYQYSEKSKFAIFRSGKLPG